MTEALRVMADAVADLGRAMRRDRARMALTLMGIALGAASIVFLASALTGASIALTKADQAESGSDLSHIRGRPAPLRSDAQTTKGLDRSDVVKLADRGGLATDRVAAGYWLEHQESSRRGKRMFTSIQAGDPQWAALGGFEIQYGHFLSPEDERERHAVIGMDVYELLFDEPWPPADDRFVVNGAVTFHVVGVMKRRPPIEGNGGGDGANLHDRRLWITNTAYVRNLKGPVPFDEVLLKHPLQGDALPDLRAIGAQLTELLVRLHNGVQNFEFEALDEGPQMANLITFVLGAILFGCGLVSMVVGAINVMNAQLMSLSERTKELGIRRALGETTVAVQTRVVTEAVVLAVAGGVLGSLVGGAMAWLLAQALAGMAFEWQFRLVPWSIVCALGLSLLAGLGAGIVPALRAKQMSLAEALRSE